MARAAKLYGEWLEVPDIAEKMGVCLATVRQYLREAGIVLRRPLRLDSPLADMEALRRRVRAVGQSEAAREFGVSRQAVSLRILGRRARSQLQ